ncbi:ABC transporter ATP-binding protein [Kineosporia sp. NBRC 101677]|nr:ABC transporter ATP-binding protein [Kineosporia sp. NBRC 101677]
MAGTHLSYLQQLESALPPLLTVSSLAKSFGSRSHRLTALDGVDLTLYEHEVLTLLGPAGSGKSATLALVAGLEKPDHGQILLDGQEVPRGSSVIGLADTDFGPRQSVRDVLAPALKARGVGRREMDDEVASLLKRIGPIDDPELRAVELSPAHQLLLAMGREAAAGAQVVLLDDPLAPVEHPLRERVQDEIRVVREEFGFALVIATRDAQQALSLSDRIAVLWEGRTVQSGPPLEIYERPANESVAELIGAVNLLGPAVSVQLLAQTATFSVRPEKIRVVGEGYPLAADEVLATGTVQRVVYLGATSRITVRLDAEGAEIQVLRLNSAAPEDIPVQAGQPVTVVWPRRHAVRFA